MMAGSKTLPSKGRIQMRETNYLQINIPACNARPTHAPQQSLCLFDDLVGTGDEYRRDVQPDRLGCLEVEHQIEARRLLHR